MYIKGEPRGNLVSTSGAGTATSIPISAPYTRVNRYNVQSAFGFTPKEPATTHELGGAGMSPTLQKKLEEKQQRAGRADKQ